MSMLPLAGSGGKQGSDSGDGNRNSKPPRDHLMPKSYEDILNFAIENTVPGDDAPKEMMSDERKKWLQEALAGMFTDEVKIMKKKLEEIKGILHSDTVEDEERKAILLEDMNILCETIDNARDYYKIGGMDVLLSLFSDRNADVRWHALEVAATTLQNNPYVQNVMLEGKVMRRFMQLLNDDHSAQVKVKALYAISCHVREHNESEEFFASNDGFSCLMKAMQSKSEKLQIKAIFLLKAILISQPKFKDNAQQLGMVQQIVGLLNTVHTTAHEHMAGALLCLVSDHPESIAICHQPQLNFRDFLATRKMLIKNKDEFQEELQFCEELCSVIFEEDNTTTVER